MGLCCHGELKLTWLKLLVSSIMNENNCRSSHWWEPALGSDHPPASSPTTLNLSELIKLGTGKTPAPVEAVDVGVCRRHHERIEEGTKYGGKEMGFAKKE